MPTTKTINITNTVHRIDDQGAQQGWGERYHDLQLDQIDALNSLSGSSDVAEQQVNLTDAGSDLIAGMSFDLSAYAAGSAIMGVMDYTIKRIDGGTTTVEAGKFLTTFGTTNGTTFDYTQESIGDDTGVTLTFNDSGEASYTATAGSSTTFFIRFKARTVSNL